jgi:glycosyltransferase involved in cell wall biosynthesis
MATTTHSDALIIMPSWNEAEAIGATIRQVREAVPHHDILVVDDGSKDETARIAAEAGAAVVILPFNLGVGGAMRAGFNYALRHGYTRAIQVDADGQHDPHDIDRVLAGLEHADISIGARFAGRGNYTAKGPRRWAMNALAKVISGVAKTTLTDVTSGFRAANLRALHQYMEHFPAEYLGDTIDSLVVAIKSGCKVTQVPVEMKVRQAGTPSHSPWKATIYLARSGLVLCFALARPRTKLSQEFPAPEVLQEAADGSAQRGTVT